MERFSDSESSLELEFEVEEDEEECLGIRPYRFEPYLDEMGPQKSDSEPDSEGQDDVSDHMSVGEEGPENDRLNNTDW